MQTTTVPTMKTHFVHFCVWHINSWKLENILRRNNQNVKQDLIKVPSSYLSYVKWKFTSTHVNHARWIQKPYRHKNQHHHNYYNAKLCSVSNTFLWKPFISLTIKTECNIICKQKKKQKLTSSAAVALIQTMPVSLLRNSSSTCIHWAVHDKVILTCFGHSMQVFYLHSMSVLQLQQLQVSTPFLQPINSSCLGVFSSCPAASQSLQNIHPCCICIQLKQHQCNARPLF